MKRKLFPILIAVLVTISIAINIIACNKETPITADKYTVNYVVAEGGYITGNVTQIIEEGLNGTPVTAKAVEGYEFDKWSDGLETAERTDTNVTENKTYTAMFRKKVYTLKYNAAKGGYIDGKAEQSVEYGSSGSKVTAVADRGYEFKNWSDGVTTEERTDLKIKTNKTITAYFTEYTRVFTLDYRFGVMTGDEQRQEKVALTYANFKETKYPIPTREHFTFNGWYIGEDRLTDADGKVTANEELIKSSEDEIYAKWTANETFTYKILLVYVTEIDATLYSYVTKSDIKINYAMTDLEREFCKLTTKRLEKYLDDMLDGLVDFVVDEYFTEETIVTDDFQRIFGSKVEYSLDPERIPEVSKMLSGYDSVLSVFNMNDYDYKLHFAAGSAVAKYAEINFDSFYSTLNVYKSSLQTAVNALNKGNDVDLESVGMSGTYLLKDYWFSVFTHELAHTIEQRVNLYSYHKTVVWELHYNQHYKPIIADKFYYLNEAVMEGKKVGIPYEFWKGDIAKVSYMVEETNLINYPYGGSIDVSANAPHSYQSDPLGRAGYAIYEILYGGSLTATAKPRSGFKFVKWSDGVTTPTRTDINISQNITVTAIFEKIA